MERPTGPGFGSAMPGPFLCRLIRSSLDAYLGRLFELCLPIGSKIVPDSPEWLHEVKYDGYRLRLKRDGDHVRLIARGGYNWTDRYRGIVEAARKIRQKRFVIDGEAVILGVDGISDFDALHSGKHNDELQLCAFDMRIRRSWRPSLLQRFPVQPSRRDERRSIAGSHQAVRS